ncbi:trimethylguanosine synthase, putative [Plasmodium relictum]|uniref:Trimethylguanosine synthase n=1 Tax=Plasmodium relictum TaxID=85471 RepID=A0A1J1HCP7_PLARL|nr:trimethylguanosine synthase, putative [Plasmodium relictum]CRH03658.1 trimethylguanosine synthase, putative [Plasmodium relictum]
MIKIKYNNFNDIRNNNSILNISFLVHPCYYTSFDLEENDLLNKMVCSNFLYFAEKINIYDKNESMKNFRKDDYLARELNFIKSSELLKNTYKYKIPIIYQNIKKFDLFDHSTINYYPINYNNKKKYIVRNKNYKSIQKERCFILDNEMIYSMTPEFISKNIGNNLLNYGKKLKKKKKNYESDIDTNEYKNVYKGYIIKGNNKKKIKREKNKNYNDNKINKVKEMILIYLDPFAGAGGNSTSIENAFTIASDISLIRIKECKHNCNFYNKNVDFILCDFFNIVNHFRKNTIDVIFLSIPWGGPTYKKKKKFELKSNENRLSIYSCLKESLKLANNLIFYLPRNVSMEDLLYLYKYYRKLVNLKKKKMKRDDIFIELYINRNRCSYRRTIDNSLCNFYYFFNQEHNEYNNEFNFSKIKKLFKINIDQCNDSLTFMKESRENISNENYEEKDECEKCKERSDESYVENNNECEKYNDEIVESHNNYNNKIKQKKTIWRWHNTSMVVYLGKISSFIRKKKIIDFNSIYYVHNSLVKVRMIKKKDKKNFSIYSFLENKKKKLFYDVVDDIKKKENLLRKLNINKNTIKNNLSNKYNNIISLNYFIKKKLYEIISKIISLFFQNIKNIIGFQKISFLNKIFIYIENDYEKILTRKLNNNGNLKKYETFIYPEEKTVTYLHPIINYFNFLIVKIKKILILLFGIYLYDISFLKYFFKYYKINLLTENINKRNLKNIHYNIIRFLFEFLLYMKIFINILNNNIKLLDLTNINFINNNFIYFLEFSNIKNKGYNYINYIDKNQFLLSYRNFIKKIILLSFNLEFRRKGTTIKKIVNIFFHFLFKVTNTKVTLNCLNNSSNEISIQYYKLNMCLVIVNFFTKQFLYNSNITSFLDYFNSLIYFYFNQIYILSNDHKNYSNIFIFYLNKFLNNKFYVNII